MSKKISEIPYLKIMREAFSITWKNRYLWWFGFFAMFSSAASFDYSGKDFEKNHSQIALENITTRYAHWIMIGALIVFLIIISLAILNIISRGALISSIEKINRKKITSFKSGFRDGKRHFFKVFLIGFFSGLFILGALIILAPPVVFLFLNHNYLIGVLMAVTALAIFIPLVILVAYLRIFGYLYAVLGGLKPWAAIENAYTLFRKNIATSIVMDLLFIPINILFLFAIILAAFPIALAIIPLGIVAFLFTGKFGAIIVGIFGLLILGVLAIYLRSFLEVFTQTAWILFFHEIASPEEKEAAPEPIVKVEPLPEPMPTINSEME